MRDSLSYTQILSALAVLVFVISGCGESNRNPDVVDTQQDFVQNPPPSFPPIDPGPGLDDGNPAIEVSFIVSGEPLDGHTGPSFPAFETPPLNTDSLLKVRITSGPAGNLTLPGYSNYTARYGCVGYTISPMSCDFNGENCLDIGAGVAVILAVEGESHSNCSNAPTSVVKDFSVWLGGPGPIKIKVDNAKYDHFCYEKSFLIGQCSSPLGRVYDYHTATGTLDIQVNSLASP